MKKKIHGITHKENLQALQELKILEEDIIAARNYVRSKYVSGRERRSIFAKEKAQVPIYLILGPARFGKTTILAHSGLDLVDAYQQPLHEVHPTKYCSFWFAQDAIYVDTAGTYTKPDVTRPRNDLIWQGFIKLLQKYFGKDSLTGVLIVLDLPAIAQDSDLLKRCLFYIRERIYETTHLVRRLQNHIVFTKCDRILGFGEFFSMLSATERVQPFGVVFAKHKQGDLIKEFVSQFDRLLQHLNRRVLDYLFEATSLEKKALLKSFPAQLDYLRPVLVEVISKIPHSSHIDLSGVYFTSSIQDGIPINPLKAVLLKVLRLKEKLNYSLESHGDCSYFIKDLFTQIVNPKSKKIAKPVFVNHEKRLFYKGKYFYGLLALTASLGAIGFFSYKSYLHNVDVIQRIHTALRTQDRHDAKTFYVLSTELEKQKASRWLKFGINKTHALSDRLLLAHKAVFAEEITAQLENFVNNLIDTSEIVDAAKLYHALTVYLMLGMPQRLDVHYVINWFNNYWAELYGEGEQKRERLQQLMLVLQRGFKIKTSQHVVNAARASLSSLPLLQQIYLLLEGTYLYRDLEITRGKNVFMSEMYLKEKFDTVYNDIIPNIATYLPQQDWVFGEAYPALRHNIDATLIANLRDHYVTQYINIWLGLFAAVTQQEFKDLASVAQYFRNMAASDSVLMGFLQQMQHHLSIAGSLSKVKPNTAERLKGLQSLNLDELRHQLDEAAYYLAGMVHNHDASDAAFVSLTKYFKNKAATNPLVVFKKFAYQQALFVQEYLLVLVNNTWQTIVDSAYRHITREWNVLIMPKYRELIVDKYPVFHEGSKEISLEDFTRFFGPRGIVDNFFNRYLEPLVVLDKTNWQWQNVDGVPLGFSPVFLEVFLRAALIQKMFYSHKTMQPHVEFSLKPLAMSPNTQNFVLHLDGQKVTMPSEQQEEQLVWPGPNSGVVTISFTGVDGKYSTITELGPWAWFKVLEKANVTSRSGTKSFDITFDLNGNAVRYALASSEPVNPFIAEVVSNFRCQEQ